MLSRELLTLVEDAREIVEIAPAPAGLTRHLRVPGDVRQHRRDPADTDGLRPGAGSVLLALLADTPAPEGPPGSVSPEEIAPVLARMRPGAQAVLLLGWPLAELPYHRLLGPLGEARCQVLHGVPLDRAHEHGGHVALVARCVDRIVPPRPYLTASGDAGTTGSSDDPTDPLPTMLRLANEWLLADLVSRPLRRRLVEQEERIAELTRLLAEQATGTAPSPGVGDVS